MQYLVFSYFNTYEVFKHTKIIFLPIHPKLYVFNLSIFAVIEAKSGAQLSPVQNFTITITPPNSDFTSPASSIDHEAIILVTQGQSVDLGYNWLSTVGHEIPDDQLEVELTNAPLHGTLVQISGTSRTEIYEGWNHNLYNFLLRFLI